jgi:hypothetical protein
MEVEGARTGHCGKLGPSACSAGRVSDKPTEGDRP